MIVSEGKYYLYRHIRLDKNEPFYVGVGTKKKGNTFIQVYVRAYTRHDRRIIWKRIVSKTDYEVEIIMESNDRSFLLKKEIEFINLYGRIDLGTGALSNLTDGGEGTTNKSREQLDKELETRKKNGSYDRNKIRLSKLHKGNTYKAKKAYLYDTNGVFVREFKNMGECAMYVGLTRSLVCKYCRDKVKHEKYIFSDTYCGDYFGMSQVSEMVFTKGRRLVKYSRNWQILEIYKTSKEAGLRNGFDHKCLKFVIERNTKYRQHHWRWLVK